MHGLVDCEASNSQNRLVRLTLTIGTSFVHTGTMLSNVCAIILQHCGTICYLKNRSQMEKTKILSCGKCCSMWLITAPIIAHNCSGCSTNWASRQRLKITSSMPMRTSYTLLEEV